MHLQFLNWLPSGVPDKPAQLLQFIADVHAVYQQQRSLIKPVLVHCRSVQTAPCGTGVVVFSLIGVLLAWIGEMQGVGLSIT